ncbi:MAG: DUF882 domain-containing protein [Caulobacteraceae bacterium]
MAFGAGAAASTMLSSQALAQNAPLPEVRRLALDNLNTGESLKLAYFEHGQYLPDALAEVNHLLRDHRNNEVRPIDTRLLDLIDSVSREIGSSAPLQVICGYRSPATNEAMHERSSGVAKHSLHIEGMAVDLRSDRIGNSRLRDVAKALGRGGVGYYPQSQFVHIDVGAVRTWQGV